MACHSPAVGVLALQGDVAEHLRALRDVGATPVPVRRPEELDAVDGLIIPGGESTTIWKLAEIFGLAEPLRKRIGGGMPAFGSCAGLILLATRLVDPASGQQTLGAIDMTVRRNAFGRQVDSFESDLAVSGLAGLRRTARCSSARPGSSRPAARSRCSRASPAPVGSSRFARVRRSQRPFIPSSRATGGSTSSSLTW